ncbi:hypothetical protein D3C80_955980 [compost metagenome]
MGACRQHRPDLAVILLLGLSLRLAEQRSRRVDQHRLITHPPIYRVSQACILMRAATGPGDMRKRKALVGARNQAGLAGVLFPEHQIPGQLIKRTATLHIIQQVVQAPVQRPFLRLHVGQAGISLHRCFLLALALKTLVALTYPPGPEQQRNDHHHDTGSHAHGQFSQRPMLIPGPVRPQPPDTGQQQHDAQQHQQCQRSIELAYQRQPPTLEVTPDHAHRLAPTP